MRHEKYASCNESPLNMAFRAFVISRCATDTHDTHPELARVTNSARLFTPGETKALAKSKVHQISRAWVTNDGWSSSLISKIWRTVRSGKGKDSKKYM